MIADYWGPLKRGSLCILKKLYRLYFRAVCLDIIKKREKKTNNNNNNNKNNSSWEVDSSSLARSLERMDNIVIRLSALSFVLYILVYKNDKNYTCT
jgi:hypothetical protein